MGMRLGLGCLRLPDGEAGVAVVHAALDAGIGLLDTADMYGRQPGDGERLLAQALRGRTAWVATKIGLTRPAEGRWVPDGRARHLTAAAEASCRRLERNVLDLLFLHAPDPRVSLATSVRALAALREAGVARAIGVSNVSLRQLDEALAVAELDAVQVKLGPLSRAALDGGIVSRCRARGIAVFAHTPLGGPSGAAKLDVPAALLWTMSLPAIPLVGASRVETARSAAAVLTLPVPLPPAPAEVAAPSEGEIVVIAGSPGAGKSTLAGSFAGFERLNRDLAGKSLDALAAELGRRLEAGGRRFVLDNTYPTRRSRAAVVAAARRFGVAVRCIVLETSLEDAQVNACDRIVLAGRPLDDPDVPPRALFQFDRGFEPPEPDEGFASIERRPFVRVPIEGEAGVVVELDGIVWKSRSGARTPVAPDDMELVVDGEKLRGAFATTWQPERSKEEVTALVARLRDLLGFGIEVVACTHGAGPPICWCRKPLPGLGVLLARRYGLAPSRTVHVGARPADRAFAARLGMRFVPAADFF